MGRRAGVPAGLGSRDVEGRDPNGELGMTVRRSMALGLLRREHPVLGHP